MLFYEILPGILDHECDSERGDEDSDDGASEDRAESGRVASDGALSDAIEARRNYGGCHQRQFCCESGEPFATQFQLNQGFLGIV